MFTRDKEPIEAALAGEVAGERHQITLARDGGGETTDFVRCDGHAFDTCGPGQVTLHAVTNF